MNKGKTFTHLSKEERIKIEVLLQAGSTLSGIARSLNRPVCTISREVNRNGPRLYRAERANYFTGLRHRQKRKQTIFDPAMKDYIELQLKHKKWSPELISVCGKQLQRNFISAEWIYQWIWRMKKSMCAADAPYQKLYRYLRHARRRWHRGRKRCMRGNIIQRKWIEQRPLEAERRMETGHLEGDIMLGKDRQPGTLVVLDRKSRKCWIRKLPTKEATYVVQKLKEISQKATAKTLTLDNDQSFALHYKLNEVGVQTFFTHPYSSQEKGSVENRIGIIRMFLPKKTDFSKVSSWEVRRIETLINKRPMRMFNYRTPEEIYKS